MVRAIMTYDVHWDGPYGPDELGEVDANYVLYMICGTHGLYGRNVPLYVGKTQREVSKRLREHKWIDNEPDPVTIYIACIGEFFSWEKNSAMEEYPPPSGRVIDAIEALLIIAHQCAYNTRSKCKESIGDLDVHIFNTGRRATLFPEVSSRFWVPAGA